MECYGHSYTSIETAIFKTLRRHETSWNFARGITRVSTHEHEHWEHCRYQAGKRSTITLVPVRSHSGIDTFCLPGRRRAGDSTANLSCPKTFLVNSVYTMFSRGQVRPQLQNVRAFFFSSEIQKGVLICSWIYFFICVSSFKATQPRFWNTVYRLECWINGLLAATQRTIDSTSSPFYSLMRVRINKNLCMATHIPPSTLCHTSIW